ncbi:MAG: T9SS type A sorting domain-containing protein [Bacteroidota bacterium]
MKACYILVSVLLYNLSNAQDWSLLNLAEKYNYQADSLSHISHTIWVDSFQLVNETDTLFFLNRVVKNIPHPTNQQLFWKTNQGQFLGKTVWRNSEAVYSFQNEKDTFLLMPNAPIGKTWKFEPQQQIEVTVISIESKELFGLEDSIKTIQLSTNHKIQISKRFGLLNFATPFERTNYELKGLQAQKLGEQIPDFWDIYNFEIGDVLMHLEERSRHTGDLDSGLGAAYVKREIIDKQIISDTLTYFYKVQEKETWHPLSGPPGTAYRQYEDSLQLINDLDHPTNKFNGQLVKNYLRSEEPEYTPDVCYINFVRFQESPEFNIFSKQINFHPWLEPKYTGDWFSGDYILTDTSEYLIPAFYCNQYLEWGTNIGRVNFDFWCHEVSSAQTFLGHTDGIDTIGIIMPDFFFTSTEEAPLRKQLEISPNPSSDHIQIGNLPIGANIQIYDMIGQLILTTNEKQIDITRLNGGIYVVVAKIEEEIVWIDQLVKVK